ncbi:hypothetical protein [Achromobacter phage shaaii_LB5]|nr:hypothetical protein [Achromobacter phage shaaii_LB5]
MALKLKLTKDEFGKLPKEIQDEYIVDGEGYTLDVDGMEDTGPLRRALDRAKQTAAERQAELDELRAKQEQLDHDTARKNKDIDTLEKQWKARQDEAVNAVSGKLAKAHEFIEKQLGHSVAESLAKELTDAHALMLPHVKSRIKVNTENGDFRTVVLDAEGKETNLTVADLAKEFRADKNFSAIMRASKASGAASPSKPNTSNADGGNGGPEREPKTPSGSLSMDYRAIAQSMAAKMKEGGDE